VHVQAEALEEETQSPVGEWKASVCTWVCQGTGWWEAKQQEMNCQGQQGCPCCHPAQLPALARRLHPASLGQVGIADTLALLHLLSIVYSATLISRPCLCIL
jgi:hypothetical protein